MKVAKLSIKNFLAISEAEIQPGKVTQIVGLNNNGKTSVLKALEVAVRGSTDGSLVKRGETEAEIIVEYDDQTVIRRRIKADGKQSVSVKKEGFAAQQPQTMLDGLFGAGAFNPLDLLEPKRRTEVLLSALPIRLDETDLAYACSGVECPIDLPPLDYSQHGLKVAQQAHKYYYQRRAEANKEAKNRAEIVRVKEAELPPMPEASADTRVGTEIQQENERLRLDISLEMEKQKAIAAQEQKVAILQRDVDENDRWIVQSEKDLAVLLERAEQMRRDISYRRQRHEELLAAREKAKAELTATGPDQARIAECNDAIQKNLQELQRRAEAQSIAEKHDHVKHLKDQACDAEVFARQIGNMVEALGAKFTAELIAKAELPIQGLTYVDDEFYLDGCRIDHLSTSAAMRLAIAVARAVAGPSKLICLDGAEALDEDTWALLRQEIQDDGFQYFISRVGEAFEAAPDDRVVEMQAGAVKSSEMEAGA